MSDPRRRATLVTGGNRGIGLAIARRHAARGDAVAVTYRTEPPALAPGEDAIRPVHCDVTVPANVDAAFAEIEDRLGPVGVLVCAHGITRDALMLRMAEDAWTGVIDANLTATFRVVRRALGPMVRAHSGRIVLVSSVVAFAGSPGQANYAASKAGLLGLARALAREVASRQVTVNVVAPGAIDTAMLASAGERRVAELTAMVPLGRVGTPDEVAAVVDFLTSDAAAYVTGALVPVDGGLGMGW